MMLPPSIPSIPSETSRARLQTGDESLTEDYGEPSEGARNLGGGVDFFATLGTDIKKKKPEKLDPEKVRFGASSVRLPYCTDIC